jgi:hypothetical protein
MNIDSKMGEKRTKGNGERMFRSNKERDWKRKEKWAGRLSWHLEAEIYHTARLSHQMAAASSLCPRRKGAGFESR